MIWELLYAILATLVFALFGAVCVRGFASWLCKVSAKSENSLDDMIAAALITFNMWFYILVGAGFSSRLLDLPESVANLISGATTVVIFFYVVRAVFRVIDVLLAGYRRGLSKERRAFATVLPSLVLIVKWVIGVFTFVFVLSNFGVDVTTLIAGLGISGLVFAFAFQRILADIFSTFVIFFDHPFAVGDTVAFGDTRGEIERVGLKTTTIRSFGGERVVVPNQDIVSTTISNLSDRPARKVTFIVPIAYTVTTEKLKMVGGIVEEIITPRENVEFDYAKLSEIGEHALLYEVVYYAKNVTYNEHVLIRQEILLGVLDALRKKKIELGYPIDLDGRDLV